MFMRSRSSLVFTVPVFEPILLVARNVRIQKAERERLLVGLIGTIRPSLTTRGMRQQLMRAYQRSPATQRSRGRRVCERVKSWRRMFSLTLLAGTGVQPTL